MSDKVLLGIVVGFVVIYFIRTKTNLVNSGGYSGSGVGSLNGADIGGDVGSNQAGNEETGNNYLTGGLDGAGSGFDIGSVLDSFSDNSSYPTYV